MAYPRRVVRCGVLLSCLAIAACRDSSAVNPAAPPVADAGVTPGSPAAPGPDSGNGSTGPAPASSTVVTTTRSPAQQVELDAVVAKLAAVKALDATSFAAKYSVPFTTDLGYTPLTAKGLDKIQASSLALDATEQTALAARGFAITERKRHPSFAYGYFTIYGEDLPVYVSADSILYAVHHSFDQMLEAVERNSLVEALRTMLGSMRASLKAGAGSDLSPEARHDADVYVAVALGLLNGSAAPPVAGGDAAEAQALLDAATAASGSRIVNLFGLPREEDFSQYKPRGHYAGDRYLARYFQATMWLGRTDLRVIETLPDHSQVFRRRQLEGAYVLRAAMDASALESWKTVDTAIAAFVGESDNMTVPQLDGLLHDLGIASAADLAELSDATIAQAIAAGAYGAQRISSHMMINGTGSGTLPLSSTFLLLGQRYVIDSHVFSNVVFDRVNYGNPIPTRMMPNPLDAAFAALHNDQAGLLLAPELTRYRYAPDLASMRVLADAHPQSFWDSNLYNGWLTALRALSPTAEISTSSAGLPRVATTEAWGRRLLSTQLASWAELRHDTLLYAKQSYTGGASCEYPDAYVEPYPEFYARLAAYAARGAALVGALDSSIAAYFANLHNVASTLEIMAKDQRSGAPHSAEHLAFINQLVFSKGCAGDISFSGWYSKLFYNAQDAYKFDPVVADVHTQPFDEAGNIVGKVLHVGTGSPRTMVVTVENCSGPRAYVGLASSYFEQVTENFQRLDDKGWATSLYNATPADVPWMKDLVQR